MGCVYCSNPAARTVSTRLPEKDLGLLPLQWRARQVRQQVLQQLRDASLKFLTVDADIQIVNVWVEIFSLSAGEGASAEPGAVCKNDFQDIPMTVVPKDMIDGLADKGAEALRLRRPRR